MRLPVALFVVAAALTARPVRAQIVNVQPLVASNAKPGASAVIEGAVDWRTGNTRLLMVSGSFVGRLQEGRNLVFLLVRGEVGLKDGNTFVSRDLEHLRWRVRLGGPFDGEVFVQHDGDEFRRLALRALGGLGPRLRLAGGPIVDAAVAVAYLFEFERLRDGREPDAGAETVAHRLSAYAVIAVRLGERLRVGQTSYVQPRLDDPHDVRILSETELLVNVSDHVALKTAVAVAFDSRPPAGVNPVDSALKTTLQVRF